MDYGGKSAAEMRLLIQSLSVMSRDALEQTVQQIQEFSTQMQRLRVLSAVVTGDPTCIIEEEPY